MFTKKFTFSGFCIEFRSERIIENSHSFSDYLSDGEPDLTVNIIFDEIPERRGRLLYDGKSVQYYSFDGREYMYSLYFVGKDYSYKTYALRVIDGENITLYINYDGGLWDSMVFEALGFPELLIKRGRALIHSSYILYKGKAIIFSADKQVGKSTQASLWEKHRNALTVNGDRAILGFEKGVLHAYGAPFCGSSKVSRNVTAPLGAIVLLRQAKENSVQKVGQAEAFRELLTKLTYNEHSIESLEKAVSLTEKIVSLVPVYRLSCLPDEGAVEALERQLEKDGILQK